MRGVFSAFLITENSADIFVSFCFYCQRSKKSANDAAHSGILW